MFCERRFSAEIGNPSRRAVRSTEGAACRCLWPIGVARELLLALFYFEPGLQVAWVAYQGSFVKRQKSCSRKAERVTFYYATFRQDQVLFYFPGLLREFWSFFSVVCAHVVGEVNLQRLNLKRNHQWSDLYLDNSGNRLWTFGRGDICCEQQRWSVSQIFDV